MGMRIGFFIPEFPGQTHSFFWREMASLTAQSPHEARIISTRTPVQPVDHDWTRGLKVTYLFPPPVMALVWAVLRLLPALPRLLRQADTRACLKERINWLNLVMAARLADICKAQGIGHLHVHSCGNAAQITAFLNRLTGMPYSLVLHGPIRDYGPNQAYKWDRMAFGFVITNKLRTELLADLPHLADRLSVVPMGVDTDMFTSAPGPRLSGAWRWFCCARLNWVKGHDILLAAARRLKADGVDFAIRIAGEDEQGGAGYRQTLERMIIEADLDDRITLLGAINQEQVLDELQQADGFVLASRHEPLGVVFMEAMACGLPTVGTDAGGVRELIEDGVSGFLVPPENSDRLAEVMLQVMREPDMSAHVGRTGRDRIVSGFSSSRSSAEIIAHLRSDRAA